MSQIHIPDALLKEIEATGLAAGAVVDFVQQAIRDKLAIQSRCTKNGPAVDEFDAICDEVALSAGAHLTRDQLHERG